jgi:outer membrane receptor for ferrienterochelin and colicin
MDEPDKARDAVSSLLRADPTYEPGPPPQLAELVKAVRRAETTVQVASVSKTNESLREAPATVVVLTAEEIERRGYNDLEEMIHDLPGFDVSRSNGEVYSSFYQRGFRSKANDRNLLLLDGVEQNELTSNSALLSRQYPMSAIERVEVVYGPASTMYGANAYTGVISVLSKEPESLIAEGRRFGYAVRPVAAPSTRVSSI